MRVVVRDRLVVVVVAVGDDGVAVVTTGQDQVDLVAALRPHLLFPEVAAGIEGDAEQVAMAVGPHGGVEALGRQRIPRRRRPIVVEAEDLAERRLRILRRGRTSDARRW
jgi:hypothetical protein